MACKEMVAVMEPQEIEDEGHEQILERVAAVDVAKASGMVCVRVPRRTSRAAPHPGVAGGGDVRRGLGAG